MGNEGERAGPRYRAFISYSHRDKAFGRRLHRRLEAYALPRRLVGRPGRMGPVPARLTPIFRDREELSAAGDLTAEVRAALEGSACLVVVCSPQAAASPWVAKEVEAFRALHPDRPVLAALASGEPAQAFPAALSVGGVEPLAADFRKEGDGARLALLKLAAGIAGVGLDALVQRDAQRRIARVTAVTAASLAAVLAMSVMTIVALDARAEAERQRAEAEGLVEFMLTDLRDRLEGVGRLDILTAVNRRALAHYAGQDLARLPADALEQRARLLHVMGEDDETRGDLAAALKQFQEARRTTAALLAAEPDKADRIFNHAQSEYWVALIDWRQQRFAAADAGFRRYAGLAARLLALDAANADWLMEAGYAESNLGMLALREKAGAPAAEASFKRANMHFAAAVAAKKGDPDLRRELADGYGWLADAQKAQGRFAEARASRQDEARIIAELLAQDPKNSAYARDRLGNALGLALIDLEDGRAEAARDRLTTTYAEASALAAADPDDAWRAKQKLATGLFLAKATLMAGGPAVAAAPYLAACRERLVQGDEEVADLCAVTAARIAAARGADDAAFKYLEFNRERLRILRRSSRWGIDFGDELKRISQERGD